jgi:HPt (histidine-containing phosphotransfer) domain-containing protein
VGVRRPRRRRCDRADQVLYRDREPAAAADSAAAASDALHVAAAVLGSRALRQAADSFDRAARQPYGRVPKPTSAGNQLRHATRLIAAYAYLTGDRTLTSVVLLVRLAALAEAVAELCESQQRAAQAAAALRAARHLRAATRPARPARSRPHQGSPDPALAIRPRYADHRHLGHAAPPAKPGRPGIMLHRPRRRLSQSPSVWPCLQVGRPGG